MGLLSPWWLAGLLAVGLPVWLHLLQQHKMDPLRFPSLQFFERRTQSSVKHRRLKYLLLFALRALMLVLLALLFAQPFLRRDMASSGGARHVLIVVDNSFSMRAGDGLDRARRQASSAIDSLSASNSAQVLSLSGGMSVLTQPTKDKAELKAAVAAIRPADGRSAFTEIARAAKTAGETLKVPVEVQFFSDLQQSSMPTSFAELRLPPNTTLVIPTAAPAPTANFAVETVTAPSTVSEPAKARLLATVAGFGTPAADKTVSLVVNGKTLQSKPVKLAAGGRASVEFLGLDASYGWNRGEVRIDGGDSLAADDTFRFAFERADPRKVLFLHEPGRTRGAVYFRAALEAGAENLFALEPMAVNEAANVSPSRYSLVVLSDVASLPPQLEDSLKKYIAAGGGVWIAAGATMASRGTVPLTGAKVIESRYAGRGEERFFTPGGFDLTHPAVAKANKWEGVRFYQAIKVDAAKARVLAKLSDDTPLLTEVRSGEGRILFFASAFDNVANDFPLHPTFVPFVEQSARYLAGIDARSATVQAGSFLELRQAGSKLGAAVDVLNPKGERALDLKASSTAETLRLSDEGYWEVVRQNGQRQLVAVNADRGESNLLPMPAESADLWKRTGEAGVAGDGSSTIEQKPQSFWWYLALLLLLTALAESFIASRYLEPQEAV